MYNSTFASTYVCKDCKQEWPKNVGHRCPALPEGKIHYRDYLLLLGSQRRAEKFRAQFKIVSANV